MTTTEDLLREAAPQALGALIRRFGDFADAEDALQEALITAAATWPERGTPDNPAGWLVRVASRRLIDGYRRDDARRRREELAASWSAGPPPPAATQHDDTLVLMLLCCHPSLTPASAIPLTLRAVGGLTTREIAAAFLVPEPTMAQRISRAKARVRASGARFAMPPPEDVPDRLRSVLHVLYLLFNEGYVTSDGPELTRPDLAAEAIRLTTVLHRDLPDEPEVSGLLALMLLTDARRHARTDDNGAVVPLAEQDRTRWDRRTIARGLRLLTAAMRHGRLGPYQLQAAITALHDEAPTYEATDWRRIRALYDRLVQVSENPMVRLNRAIAVAMLDGPAAGLALLDDLDEALAGHHRLAAARAHLLELAGDHAAAAAAYRDAADRSRNLRERRHLAVQAARATARAGSGTDRETLGDGHGPGGDLEQLGTPAGDEDTAAGREGLPRS